MNKVDRIKKELADPKTRKKPQKMKRLIEKLRSLLNE